MTDPVTHWAMIQSKLKDARRACLEAEGITESGLRDLETEAMAHVDDPISTEYGTVQKIFDKPVQFFTRRLIGTEPFKHKLKLLQQEES
jgi:hypothetical protein